MPNALDQIDIRIIDCLQKDGRISNVDLADRVALSPTPCLRGVKRLEEQGIIEGYRAELSRQRLGFGVTAFVHVNIERHTPKATKTFLDSVNQIDEVVSCHILTGSFDFLLEIVAESLEAYSNVMLERLGAL